MLCIARSRSFFLRFNKEQLTGLLLLLVLLNGVIRAEQRVDAACRGCHATQGLSVKLPSGEILPLAVDLKALDTSVHQAVPCTGCHTNIQTYPHPEITAHDRRGFQVERYPQCRTCHPEQYKDALDSNHARVLAAGNRDGATCIDCHGSHSMTKPAQPRQRISTNCGQCHQVLYQEYLMSAHGKALLEKGNPDAPVCTDCHGAHRQEDPTTAAFRLKSPKLCNKCHGNAAMMSKYNLSPDVFNTYVADFHGLTVTLFEKEHPDQEVNKAVCTDCHGVHKILKVSEAGSAVVKENLLKTCRRCHPDADANFPDSWVGHFAPSRDRFPLVYYVNLFYWILIPVTIGGMVLFVLIDAGGRMARRFRRNRSNGTEDQTA